ncbi:phage tail sheath family protein [Phytohabitans suffuscus]|uniref:Tail protein n=1 Tax=Phytohabitans suffuscus TaxID=624315 RepID=A0A6F8YR84_9ACTN|nr:phage tail sheath subtilisin-like domain-containing protein [Phytohabitans suffuscus]BCB88705.1 tail protein [Phytohabitans suffuscus]
MPNYLSPGVYVEEVSSGSKPIEGVGTAVAAFVGFAEKGPTNTPVLVTNWTQFTQAFGQFVPGAYLAGAVYGYFLNGGGAAYVVRVGDAPSDGAAGANGSADAAPTAHLPAAGGGRRTALVARLRDDAVVGAEGVTVEVADGTESAETFRIVVSRDGQPVETFDNLTLRKGARNVVTVVATESRVITLEEVKGATLAGLARGTVSLTRPATPAVPVAAVAPEAYVGDASARTGFAGLEAIDDVTMLAVPDLMSAFQAGLIDLEGVKAVQLAMIAHCELMADRVAILDTPPGLNAQQVKQWRVEVTGYDSKHATMYWPWIKVMDPVAGKPVFQPPSGYLAGVWARNDATRGVHKAPANEVLRGVVSLEYGLTRGEHDQLNPVAVNCIRAFPGQGIRVWGARTLSSDPEWRYLNVRRLFNYVEKSILLGTNWVVFEPNDAKLWDSVKRTVTMFLRGVWRDGALFGTTPGDAFFVKCDAENNPAESRDQGVLNVEIGIAPVKPAEFVVFRLSQFADGGGVSE